MFILIRKIFELVKSIAISLIIAVFIINFMFQIVIVNGESMIPTLQNNDKLILEKISYSE